MPLLAGICFYSIIVVPITIGTHFKGIPLLSKKLAVILSDSEESEHASEKMLRSSA